MKIKISKLSNTVLMYYEQKGKPIQKTELNEVVQVALKLKEPKKNKPENNRIMSVSNNTKSRFKKMGRLLLLEKEVKTYAKLITITTCQKKNGLSDAKCKEALRKFIDRNKLLSYMYVCERQKNGDIHFHLILNENKIIDIEKNVVLLNKHLPYTGTNVLNIKTLTKKRLNSFVYLVKYATKESSTFCTKPTQISKGLLRFYKDKSSKYEYFLDNTYDESLMQHLEKYPPKTLRSENYYSIWHYDEREFNFLFDTFKPYSEGLFNKFEKVLWDVNSDMQVKPFPTPTTLL